MSHDELKELLAAFALDSLDGEEARAVEEHLEGCAECRGELERLRDTAGLLALAVDPVTPPAEVRERLLAQVGGESRRHSFPERRAMPVWRRPVPLVGGLALAAGLAWLLVLQATTRSELQETRHRLDQALARLDDAQAALARERATTRLLAAPEAVSVALKGTEAAPEARAKVAYEPNSGEAILFAADLRPPPPGKGYQLWFIAGNRPPQPGKVFVTDRSGRGELSDQIPTEARKSPVFAVTVEPASGVPAPTGPIVLISAKP
jgi:anti-sigma-K factor RskA